MTAPSPRGVFGFSVESALSFRFLRDGTAPDVLRVDEAPGEELAHESTAIAEWRFKDPTGDVSGRLHRADGVYHFWTADAGWFRIDSDARRITVPHEADAVRRELRTWGVPTTLCSVGRGDVSLHAAAVEIDGGAVLFGAPGQHGKTTLALACHTAGYRVLSEDVSCCRFGPTPMLYPGPASLRVRPDMFHGDVPAGTQLVSVKPDRVFLRLDDERCGTADPVPIRAIFLLHWSDDDIHIERIGRVKSLPDLWALSFRVPGSTSMGLALEGVGRLAASTVIWNLYRPLRADNLRTVVDRIAEAALVRSG